MVEIEKQSEYRAYDFNSLWTSLVAMLSAFIGLFSFFFRNVLPKRFFAFGNKSFHTTHEQFEQKLQQQTLHGVNDSVRASIVELGMQESESASAHDNLVSISHVE